jgi:hypothetical protein
MNTSRRPAMNEEALNLSLRKFLKSFGVNGQREIEQAVANGRARGVVVGTETLPAKVTLQIAGLNLNWEFEGEIALG